MAVHTYIFGISLVHAGGPEGAGNWQLYCNIVLLTHTLPYGHGRFIQHRKTGGIRGRIRVGGVLMTSRRGILLQRKLSFIEPHARDADTLIV